ncbi:MAG: TrkA C-terminal domain-containing protein [Bacteroidota bacterium]
MSINELLTEEYFILFVIMAIGIAIGKIKIKGIGLDLSAVIFVAMTVGWIYHFFGISFQFSEVINRFGLVLFIYTIGMQAGPSFFESFKSYGYKIFLLVSIILVSAALISYFLVSLLDIDKNLAVGLFTGAITSASGLAAASEVSSSPLVTIGYGIAFPVGIVTILVFVKFSNRIFKIDISAEENKIESEKKSKVSSILNRHFEVSNDNINNKSLKQIDVRKFTNCSVARIMRADGELVIPTDKVTLHCGDIIKAVGKTEDLEKVEILIGKVTDRKIPSYKNFESKWYVVTNKNVVSKTLRELNLMSNYNSTVTRIRRSGLDISPNADIKIRYGDKIMVSSPKGNSRAFKKMFGDKIKQLSETSFLPVALGIVLGVLLGSISFPLFGLDISLGLTGGVLIVSILTSYKGKTGPIIWNLTGPANHLLRHLGLLLFLIPIGLEIGSQISDTIDSFGYKLFAVSFFITLVPMVLAVAVAKYIFNMNFLVILGALSGGMNSTPGLTVAETVTDSEAPQIAYAAVYPFGLVLIIVIAQLMGMLI